VPDAPKPVHADECKPSEPIKRVPSLADAGLDGDLDPGIRRSTAFLYSIALLWANNSKLGTETTRVGVTIRLKRILTGFSAISTSDPVAKIESTSSSLADTSS
jgi:hypothetical protein